MQAIQNAITLPASPDPGTPPAARLITLIGLPGSGKTTVGKMLATRLGWEFHDTDQIIQMLNPEHSLATLWEKWGEKKFRRAETRILGALVHSMTTRKFFAHLPICPGNILATGGGIVESKNSRAILRKKTYPIYLRARLKIAQHRWDFVVCPAPAGNGYDHADRPPPPLRQIGP